MRHAKSRPHVVIVGAGFGGLAAAKRLVHRNVKVTLVDQRNHHVFQPLLYQVATAALSPADIAGPIRSIFSRAENISVVLDEVTGIDAPSGSVSLASGKRLYYDRLILATGARHSYFNHDDWAANAPGLKSIEDALAIRRKILLALERAETESSADRRQALLTFVVIGGGPTGVEMAGAIAELARRSVSRDFRNISPRCSRVILIEAGERILPSFPSALSSAAERSLTRLGVELHLGRAVSSIGKNCVELGEDRISANTIIWAAGVQASPAAKWLSAYHDKQGRVMTDVQLRAPGYREIFVIGDTANVVSSDGSTLPAIAPVAKQQGRYVADVILGRQTGPFRYRHFGNLATVGRCYAVIDFGKVKLSGLLAWLLWCAAHVWFLIGFRSRLAVSISWLWNYLTFQRSARLITGEFDREPHRADPLLQRKCA